MLEASVIIPAYNNTFLISKNLPKVLEAAKNKKNQIVEVIVVDDASTDKTYELVKTKFKGVKLIKHKINRGFSATVNTGARAAKGKLLVLLNTDVSPERNFMEAVLPDFRNKYVFAVSLHEVDFGWSKGEFKDGFIGHFGMPATDRTTETFWASGGTGVFRRDYWMDLGGLDEKLLSPFYWEDIDICYRALKRGLKILWEPGALVNHEHEATNRKIAKEYRQNIQERNQLLFIWKNLTSPILFRKHLGGLSQRITKHPGYLKIVYMALKKINIVIKERQREKKEATVSDETIFAHFENL